VTWEDVGPGPTEDTEVRRAEVPGGWLYAVVATTYSTDRLSGVSDESARIVSTAFVPRVVL
jgi:hypothetical protein